MMAIYLTSNYLSSTTKMVTKADIHSTILTDLVGVITNDMI